MSLQHMRKGMSLTLAVGQVADFKQRTFPCIYANHESASPAEATTPKVRIANNGGDRPAPRYVNILLARCHDPWDKEPPQNTRMPCTNSSQSAQHH